MHNQLQTKIFGSLIFKDMFTITPPDLNNNHSSHFLHFKISYALIYFIFKQK